MVEMDAMVSGVEVEAVEVDRGSSSVRIQFDQEKTPASMAVVATLADVMDADPVDLEPLYATVDPDALDALVTLRHETSGDVHVRFTHEGHAITVSSYGVVTVSPGRELAAEHNVRDAKR